MSKVLSGATPALFRKTSPSAFFTMLTFYQILNIYLQWMAALNLAIVCKVESELPTYGKSSCQYNHGIGPRCTVIIPYRLSMVRFSCQSQCVIWEGGIEAPCRRRISEQTGVLCVSLVDGRVFFVAVIFCLCLSFFFIGVCVCTSVIYIFLHVREEESGPGNVLWLLCAGSKTWGHAIN